MDEYELYLRGFKPGALEAPEFAIARVFGLDLRRARELLRSLPRVVKRHVPSAERERYEQALRSLGADFELRRSAIRPVQTIQVVGGAGAPREDAGLEQHGSTLTLPVPQFERAPPQPLPAPAPETVPARAPAYVPAPEPAPVLSSASTWREIEAFENEDVLDALPQPDLPQLPALPALPQPASLAQPVQPRLPQPQAAPPQPSASPVAAPAVGPPSRDAWRSIEPKLNAAPSQAGELPEAWEVPGLQLDGRPGWLVDGPRAYDEQSVGTVSFDSEGPAPPASLQSVQPQRPRAAPMAAPRAVGNVLGRELAVEPSAFARFMLRAGIGVSLFVLLTSVRQFPAFDRGVERALARWGETPAAGPGARVSGVVAGAPAAREWLDSDLHQVSSGDKDRVRGLVERLLRAGASAVHVGRIQHTGPLQIAGELQVELPSEPQARRLVLAEYKRFLEGSFGGLAGEPADPAGGVLHIAL